MSLLPSRTKYRKSQRGRIRGKAKRGDAVVFGDYGMQTIDRAWLTASQIEAARIAINRYLKRKGKLWIRIFPNKPISQKPAETRMGKGKGSPEYWVAVVKPGRILFEIEGLDEKDAEQTFKLCSYKLPIKTKTVGRREVGV